MVRMCSSLRVLLALAGIVFTSGDWSGSPVSAQEPSTAKPFPVAMVRMERNASDEDLEVVFEVTGLVDGLAKLTITGPDGRTVADFSAPDATTLGIRQFRMESPEPRDIEGLKKAYPEGIYTFDGVTAGGEKLRSQSQLSHALPATAAFIQPAADAEAVSPDPLILRWTTVKDLAATIISLEQEESGINLEVRLPGSPTSFAVPRGFLGPGTRYKLAIGTVSKSGGVSVVETTFTTSNKK